MLFDLTSLTGFLVDFCAIYSKCKFYTFQTEIGRSESNGIRTQNHLVRKRRLNHLAKLACLAEWLSVRLRTKWLWVRISLLSPKHQIWRLLWARSSLPFRQTIECGSTLKLICDMMITRSRNRSLLNNPGVWVAFSKTLLKCWTTCNHKQTENTLNTVDYVMKYVIVRVLPFTKTSLSH